MKRPLTAPPRPARSRANVFIGVWIALSLAYFGGRAIALVAAELPTAVERGRP